MNRRIKTLALVWLAALAAGVLGMALGHLIRSAADGMTALLIAAMKGA